MTYRCRAPAWKATIALLHTPWPFLAATHFREHKTRETLCRTQEYEVHEALERRPNTDLLEASMVVKSVEFYMISIQSPLTKY